MESLKEYWNEVMEIQEVRWIVIVAGLVTCLFIAIYIVKFFRDMALGKSDDPTDFITDCQKMREEGKLDDEEYSKLQKAIPRQIPNELSGKQGEVD